MPKTSSRYSPARTSSLPGWCIGSAVVGLEADTAAWRSGPARSRGLSCRRRFPVARTPPRSDRGITMPRRCRPGHLPRRSRDAPRGPRHPCGRQASRTLDHRHRERQVTHRLLHSDGLRPRRLHSLPKPRVHRASTGPGDFWGPHFREERRSEGPFAGRVGRDGEEVSCRRSWPLPDERGDHYDLPGREQERHIVYSTSDPAKGKLSHTAYRVLKQTKHFALLEVDLLTGRKNRDPSASRRDRTPYRGRQKVRRRKEPYVGLALHARSISFTHPCTGQRLTFAAEVPAYFRTLVGSIAHQDGL